MKTRIESKTIGLVVFFRMSCDCGRVGVWHRDLSTAEGIADKHVASEHREKVSA